MSNHRQAAGAPGLTDKAAGDRFAASSLLEIYTVSYPELSILQVNAGAAAATGHAVGDLVGQPLSRLNPRYPDIIARAGEQPQRQTLRHCHASGESYPVVAEFWRAGPHDPITLLAIPAAPAPSGDTPADQRLAGQVVDATHRLAAVESLCSAGSWRLAWQAQAVQLSASAAKLLGVGRAPQDVGALAALLNITDDSDLLHHLETVHHAGAPWQGTGELLAGPFAGRQIAITVQRAKGGGRGDLIGAFALQPAAPATPLPMAPPVALLEELAGLAVWDMTLDDARVHWYPGMAGLSTCADSSDVRPTLGATLALVHPTRRGAMIAALQGAMERGEPWRFVTRLASGQRALSSARRWHDPAGRSHLAGVFLPADPSQAIDPEAPKGDLSWAVSDRHALALAQRLAAANGPALREHFEQLANDGELLLDAPEELDRPLLLAEHQLSAFRGARLASYLSQFAPAPLTLQGHARNLAQSIGRQLPRLGARFGCRPRLQGPDAQPGKVPCSRLHGPTLYSLLAALFQLSRHPRATPGENPAVNVTLTGLPDDIRNLELLPHPCCAAIPESLPPTERALLTLPLGWGNESPVTELPGLQGAQGLILARLLAQLPGHGATLVADVANRRLGVILPLTPGSTGS